MLIHSERPFFGRTVRFECEMADHASVVSRFHALAILPNVEAGMAVPRRELIERDLTVAVSIEPLHQPLRLFLLPISGRLAALVEFRERPLRELLHLGHVEVAAAVLVHLVEHPVRLLELVLVVGAAVPQQWVEKKILGQVLGYGFWGVGRRFWEEGGFGWMAL